MIEVEKNVYVYCTVYYIKGTKIFHREDGPAVERFNGSKEWWINNLRHREDGPAIIHENGKLEWWLNNCFFKTKEKWFETLTEKQQVKAIYSDYFIK
jgi:hypothetical protein